MHGSAIILDTILDNQYAKQYCEALRVIRLLRARQKRTFCTATQPGPTNSKCFY